MATDRRRAQVKKSRPSNASYVVHMTDPAKAAYLKLKERARSNDASASTAIVALAKVEQLIREVLPKDPTATQFTLYEPFNGMYRANADTWSVGWVVVNESRQVLVLFIHTACKFRQEKVPEIIAMLHQGGHLNKLIQQTSALAVPDNATRH